MTLGPSLPRADDHDAQVKNYIETLRITGRDSVADAYQQWFDWGVLYIDSSGRIVEAGAPPTT